MKKQTDRQQTDAATEPINPFTALNHTILAAVAQQVGMTVGDLQSYLTESHTIMTCPLCGKAHNKLVICQGCGQQAWCAEETTVTTNEPVLQQLRKGLAVTLKKAAHPPEASWSAEQIRQAVRHAYQPGGCRICQECWETAVSAADHHRCPLYLHADHMAMMHDIDAEPLQPALDRPEPQTPAWVAQIAHQWLEVSSAATQTLSELKSTVGWRRAILQSALDNS